MKPYPSALDKYAQFSGRAERKEYWNYLLFFLATIILLNAILPAGIAQVDLILFVSFIALFIPLVAVSVRRLHDIGNSSWWLLTNFIPLVGIIIFLVFMSRPSEAGENKYGNNN